MRRELEQSSFSQVFQTSPDPIDRSEVYCSLRARVCTMRTCIANLLNESCDLYPYPAKNGISGMRIWGSRVQVVNTVAHAQTCSDCSWYMYNTIVHDENDITQYTITEFPECLWYYALAFGGCHDWIFGLVVL